MEQYRTARPCLPDQLLPLLHSTVFLAAVCHVPEPVSVPHLDQYRKSATDQLAGLDPTLGIICNPVKKGFLKNSQGNEYLTN